MVRGEVRAPRAWLHRQHTLEVGRSQDAPDHGLVQRCRSLVARHGVPQCPVSDLRQALAALGAARSDDGTAAAGLHADEKTVRAGAACLGRLVGALHGHFLQGFFGAATLGVGRTGGGRMPDAGCGMRVMGLRCDLVATLAAPCGAGQSVQGKFCQRAPARRGNPLLEQKAPLRSNTCTTNRGLAGGLTGAAVLWITMVGGPRQAYNATALRTTCPQ